MSTFNKFFIFALNLNPKRFLFLFTRLPAYYRRLYLSQTEEMHGTRYGERVRGSHASFQGHSPQIATCSPARKLSGPSSGFLWRPHRTAGLMKPSPGVSLNPVLLLVVGFFHFSHCQRHSRGRSEGFVSSCTSGPAPFPFPQYGYCGWCSLFSVCIISM